MNRDILEGQWMQLKGRLRQQWGKLTDDDIAESQGNAELLLGKLQAYYGKSREQVEQEVDRWLEHCQGPAGAGPQDSGDRQHQGGRRRKERRAA